MTFSPTPEPDPYDYVSNGVPFRRPWVVSATTDRPVRLPMSQGRSVGVALSALSPTLRWDRGRPEVPEVSVRPVRRGLGQPRPRLPGWRAPSPRLHEPPLWVELCHHAVHPPAFV